MSAADRAAFLRAIADNPDDDLPRLVYADWLDEHGEPDRAEFVRVQCELARLRQWNSRYEWLDRRQQRLYAQHYEEWVPDKVRDAVELSVERGFIDTIVVTSSAQLAAMAEELFATHPVRRVRVENLRPAGLRTVVDLPQLAALAELDVSGGAIGNAGVEALVRSPHLSRLTYLDLSGNVVGDVGAQRLAECAALAALHTLALVGNRLGDTAAEALAASPYLTSLTRLDVRRNPVGPDGRALLRARYGDAVKL